MKNALKIYLLFILFTGCQKELSTTSPTVVPVTPGSTDTSIILIKKSIDHAFAANDTTITTYRNNKLNGVKGYIITDSNCSAPNPVLKTRFSYDNAGKLTLIKASEKSMPLSYIYEVILDWSQGRIDRIRTDQNGMYSTDRSYSYAQMHDTLLIKYIANIYGSYRLDSASVIISADTGQNKINAIYKSGLFDYTNTGFNLKGSFYNQRTFQYAGNSILSAKFLGETWYNQNSASYLYERDSSYCTFTRATTASPFLNDLEKNIFGKEFRMLCYDQTDSLPDYLDGYFNYGSLDYSGGAQSRRQDMFQYGNVFNAAFSPLTQANINYVVWHDAAIAAQQTALTYRKLNYTFDSQNRITSIKEYDPATNALATEYYYTYP